MPLLPLNLQDPALAPYRQLHGFRGVTQTVDGTACFICEGRFLTARALQELPAHILSLVCEPSAYAELKNQIASHLPVYVGDKTFMQELAGFDFHRGVLCAVKVPTPPPLAALLNAKRLLVLPRLDGVDNLGLLLRSAAALGFDGVLLGKGPEVFDRRTIRVSMGAAWKIPVFRAPDDELLLPLAQWKAHNIDGQIIAAALVKNALDARDFKPASHCALMLGPEGYGLDAHHLDACDTHVFIPMHAGMDSLNVAACGAILMYQMGC